LYVDKSLGFSRVRTECNFSLVAAAVVVVVLIIFVVAGLTKSTFNNGTRLLRLHPYGIATEHSMRHDLDPALRSEFCQNFLRCVQEVENFEQHFIMTDE
jgi:hypothetical protein